MVKQEHYANLCVRLLYRLDQVEADVLQHKIDTHFGTKKRHARQHCGLLRM